MIAKKANLTPARQRWKHLREYKSIFWKAERKAYQSMIRKELKD